MVSVAFSFVNSQHSPLFYPLQATEVTLWLTLASLCFKTHITAKKSLPGSPSSDAYYGLTIQ